MGLRLQAGEIRYLGGRGLGTHSAGSEGYRGGASGIPHRMDITPRRVMRGLGGVGGCGLQKSCPGGGGSVGLLHHRGGCGVVPRCPAPPQPRRDPKPGATELTGTATRSGAAPPNRPSPPGVPPRPAAPGAPAGVPRSPRCPVPAALTRVCSYCSSRCASLSEAMVPPLPPLLAVPVPVPAAAAAAPPGPCGADPGHCPGEGQAALRLRRQRPAPAASAGQEVTGPGAACVCVGLSCSGVPSTRGLCPQVSQLRVAPVGSRWVKTGVGWPRVQLPVGNVVPSSHGHKRLAWGWRCRCSLLPRGFSPVGCGQQGREGCAGDTAGSQCPGSWPCLAGGADLGGRVPEVLALRTQGGPLNAHEW